MKEHSTNELLCDSTGLRRSALIGTRTIDLGTSFGITAGSRLYTDDYTLMSRLHTI